MNTPPSLTAFLQQLFTEGQVTINGKIVPFDAADLNECGNLLADIYAEDCLNMPGQAPAYDAGAALWAAKYLYTALQLTAIRDIEAEKLPEHIEPFPGEITPAAIYSADLVLRHLPAVIHLAKGLAPGDAVVQLFLQTAAQWPFSSVGLELTAPPDESLILAHRSLRMAYADRIIQQKDLKRIQQNPEVKTAVLEVLGDYAETFWPKFILQEALPQT